jgi:hypothetical protein
VRNVSAPSRHVCVHGFENCHIYHRLCGLCALEGLSLVIAEPWHEFMIRSVQQAHAVPRTLATYAPFTASSVISDISYVPLMYKKGSHVLSGMKRASHTLTSVSGRAHVHCKKTAPGDTLTYLKAHPSVYGRPGRCVVMKTTSGHSFQTGGVMLARCWDRYLE